MLGSPAIPVVAAAAVQAAIAAVAAIEWTNTITLGSIIVALVIGVGTVAVSVYGIKFKVAYTAASSAAEELRKSLHDAQHDREELRVELRDAHETMLDQRSTIERLEKLPDFTRLVELMSETAERQIKALSEISDRQDTAAQSRLDNGLLVVGRLAADHEQQAKKRHEELTALLRERGVS